MATMWLRGYALTVVLALFCISRAQGSQTNPDFRSGQDLDPASLLRESYKSGLSLDLEDRLYLLGILSSAAGEIEPSLCKLWSVELFGLSFKLPMEWSRVAHEKGALVSLAAVDPIRSFQLLQTVDNPVAMPDGSMPEDVRADAATYIFPAYWKTGHTARKLEHIGSQADRLGNTGQYPYLAVFPILQTVLKTNEKEAYAIFYKALGYYRLGSASEREDEDFVDALNAIWPDLPADLRHAALQVAITRLVSDQSKPHQGSVFSARIATKQSSVTTNNRALLQLYRLIPKVRELNSRWADQLLESYPPQGPKPTTGSNIVSSGDMTIAFDQSRTSSSQIQALTQQANSMAQYSSAMELALTDPSKASALGSPLADWQRVALLAQEATGYATADPQKANELLKEATSQLDSLVEPTERFNATVVVAQSAVAIKEGTIAGKLLANGLELGVELCEEQLELRLNSPVYDTKYFHGLEQLTTSGTQFDAHGTVDKLRGINNLALRSDLLGDAAQIIFAAENETQ